MKRRAYTHTPQPRTEMRLPKPSLTDAQKSTLGDVCMNLYDISLGMRGGLDSALTLWDTMYEMQTIERDSPWPQASNFVVPVVSTAIDELTSRVVGTIYQPRMIIVRGNDPQSSQYAHIVEQFLNAEAERNKWWNTILPTFKRAALDGTGIQEILWDLTTRTEVVEVDEPDEDPIKPPKKALKRVKYVDYDAPRWSNVELRDFVLYPVYAGDIDSADAVIVKVYLGEHDLRKMVASEMFEEEDVEAVLASVSSGQGDRGQDQQGNATYTIAGKITVADVSVGAPADTPMARGPQEFLRFHTNLFDLDGDDEYEENIIWVHVQSRKMVGFVPYEYPGGKRPFRTVTPIQRPGRFYGISYAERLHPVQDEVDAIHNGRLDWQDLVMQPQRYHTKGARINQADKKVGPGSDVEVNDPKDIGYIPMPSTPMDLFESEKLLLQYADKITGAPGAAAIAQPSASGGRVSARQAQTQAAIQGMSTALLLQEVRRFLKESVEFSLDLYCKYGPSQLETLQQTETGAQRIIIPREILRLNYTISIAGEGGPLDKEARRQDINVLLQAFSQNPILASIVQGNPARAWNFARMYLETYDFPEPTAFIGTLEETMQAAQQKQQAQEQQQKQQMVMQVLSHGKFGGAQQGGSQQPPKKA